MTFIYIVGYIVEKIMASAILVILAFDDFPHPHDELLNSFVIQGSIRVTKISKDNAKHYKSFAASSRTNSKNAVDEGGLISSQQCTPAYGQSDERSDREVWMWGVIGHPPYSPDVAPSDFHMFPSLKKHLGGMKFANGRQGARTYLRSTPIFATRTEAGMTMGFKNSSYG